MFALPFLHSQILKALRPPGYLLALLLLQGLGVAEPQKPRVSPAAVQVALPQFSDAMGWRQPKYYSTIQTVDIDGDGQSEVLARWINGLNIYRFENGTLIRQSQIPALSDNAGFYEPSWYSTIRAAVLDPKLGQSDIIARESDGMHVFRYNRGKHTWHELGSNVSVRPFADSGAGGTDWTQPKYYSTIQLADLTGDGVAELVGRGSSGMQAWQWDCASQSWAQIGGGGELTDDQGFDKEPYYSSIQLIDIDHDGIAELLARSPTGVQTYKWASSGWTVISSNGPFGDDPEFLASKRYKSVHTSVDATGQAWLYGVAGKSGGRDAIQVHRWDQNHWQAIQTIPLPGSGWDRESQSSTLLAADIQGNTDPEFLVRGPRSLYAFDLKGHSLPAYSQSFTDAQGWNLTEQYSTLKTASVNLMDDGVTHHRMLILGRGNTGLEAYKFNRKWTDAADPGFPQYCSNLVTDTKASCLSYKLISQKADSVDDIRSTYTLATNTVATFNAYLNAATAITNPFPSNSPSAPIFEAVRMQMENEFGYGKTVEGWFANNDKVLTDNYNASGDLLTQARTDVSLATSASVVSKWLEFAADIVGAIAGTLPGAGADISLTITILEDTFTAATAGTNGDIKEQIAEIATSLNQQRSSFITASATQKTTYLTNYSKMQQMGLNAANRGYDWANATVDAVAEAKTGGEHGMLINFYRTLLPASGWAVFWCDDNTNGGGGPGPHCRENGTRPKYDCTYGLRPDGGFPAENAFIYAGQFQDVNWSLLDRLTGPATPGTDNLNAIWYMMLLGGDLGWDLPQFGVVGTDSSYLRYPDPNLAYPEIEHGYKSRSASCAGNGSFNGTVSTAQTLGARLSVAQQNSARITASEAPKILQEILALKEEAKAISPDSDVELDLTSPLREAVKLVEQCHPHAATGQELSVSATTPTHLMELFIRRSQLLTPRLGEGQAQHLTTHAYCLISKLEGQSEARESCRR